MNVELKMKSGLRIQARKNAVITFRTLMVLLSVVLFVTGDIAVSTVQAEKSDSPALNVPGVVINDSPSKTRKYIGCPSIAILPDGSYVASHSFFGACPNNQTRIFSSHDKGKTWSPLADLKGQWWSNLFVHQGHLYIMGTTGLWGDLVIRRSKDGGKTWSKPTYKDNGVLLCDARYHTAPMPMLVHNGRIWRAVEVERDYPYRSRDVHPYRSFVMSAPVDADLLKAENWNITNYLKFDLKRVGKKLGQGSGGWREGNLILAPNGKLVNVLRIDDAGVDRADILAVSNDGNKIYFDEENWGLIDFPGGRTKFTIRYDPISKRYWALTNKQKEPAADRNILTLISSDDLKTWEVNSVVLRHPDRKNTAFQYVDWQFEGNDIIFVSRTAYGDSHNFHDANYFTFHRLENFRKRKITDPRLNN